MHVDILCPHALFQKHVRYEIPEFQRPYVWEQETQWEPLWNDVRNVAEEYLDSGKNQPHFMGAVVLQQQLTPTNQIETRIVVERATTADYDTTPFGRRSGSVRAAQ